MRLSNKKKVFCIAGTRPEYIKLFPVYKELKNYSDELEVFWVNSGQHTDLLQSLEELFTLKPDFSLDLSTVESSSLALRASSLLRSFAELYESHKPDLVVVQGDTITAEKAALAAYYHGGISIAHVEAGLRSFNIHAPFPEELSRRLIDQISNLNFAPTESALRNLENESELFKDNSNNFLVGNTVVDSLNLIRKLIDTEVIDWKDYYKIKSAFENSEIDLNPFISHKQKFILITLHRRENFEQNSSNLQQAVLKLAKEFRSLNFLICVHPSSRVRESFLELHKEVQEQRIENVFLLSSLAYPVFVKLMMNSEFIFSDSGGVQEEAHYLGKTVLVLRNETERIEGIVQGLNKLIGTSEERIYMEARQLIINPGLESDHQLEDLYGDGKSSSRIAKIIFESLSK